MSDPPEVQIRLMCDARDYERAATHALEAYGREIERFLRGRLRNPADAKDAYGMFCEDLWSGLPQFGWRCTLRGWAYTLARHAELRLAASPARRAGRAVAPSDVDIAAQTRTSTAPYVRTDVKDRFRSLRSRLNAEDQLILILRVDRELEWRDIAHVLASGVEAAEPEVDRVAARVRKRFQIIKERLRRWAIEEGLLPASRAA